MVQLGANAPINWEFLGKKQLPNSIDKVERLEVGQRGYWLPFYRHHQKNLQILKNPRKGVGESMASILQWITYRIKLCLVRFSQISTKPFPLKLFLNGAKQVGSTTQTLFSLFPCKNLVKQKRCWSLTGFDLQIFLPYPRREFHFQSASFDLNLISFLVELGQNSIF